MFNHNIIEKKWRKYWIEKKTYAFKDQIELVKFYCLDMFPYPSGSGLHIGHLKGYLGTEILARQKKMQGYNVLHPIGWDAFGLPAEQYAINTKNHPSTFTQKNINNFQQQLSELGFTYDFDLTINTSDPKYYKITQWIFQQFYLHNLLELKDIDVNWCPELKSVLANEEIIEQNNQRVSERGNYPVIYRPLQQWILKITEYSKTLLRGLEKLDWPTGIKEHQINWIGQKWQLATKWYFDNKEIILYFDNPEELLNLTKIFCNEWHQLFKIAKLQEKPKISTFLFNLLHPITKKEISVFFEVNSCDKNETIKYSWNKKKEKGKILVENFLKKYPEIKLVETQKLQDWIFSRQRYWGEPIPLYFDQKKNVFLEKKLPLILPTLQDFHPRNDFLSPLANATEWTNFIIDGKKYHRETSTMPNWAGSCWYYIAYLLKKDDGTYWDLTSPEAQEKMQRWLPVDFYLGGQEHAVLHLLYARFWHQFLYKIKLVPTPEPFFKLINQGMILGNDGQKMSKSKGNVINPSDIVKSHGADALRLYLAFMGPIQASLPWNETGLNSMRKWINKIYKLFQDLNNKEKVNDNEKIFVTAEAKLIQDVENAISKMNINVGVSSLMIYANVIQKENKYTESGISTFVKILSLYAPHFAEELWSTILKKTYSVYHSEWPKMPLFDIQEQEIKIFFNNIFKFIVKIPIDLTEENEKIKYLLNLNEVKLLISKKNIKNYLLKNKVFNILSF